MDSIIGTYNVTYKNEKAGELIISKKGTYYIFSFRSDVFYTEILRLVCVCENHFIPIGIPIPDGSCLSLRKQYTVNALSSMGFAAIENVILHPTSEKLPEKEEPAESVHPQEAHSFSESADPDWESIRDPQILFEDEELKSACCGITGALIKRSSGKTLLAVPLSSSEPFPMMPVFCFGESQLISGRQYVVFTVKSGRLV